MNTNHERAYLTRRLSNLFLQQRHILARKVNLQLTLSHRLLRSRLDGRVLLDARLKQGQLVASKLAGRGRIAVHLKGKEGLQEGKIYLM